MIIHQIRLVDRQYLFRSYYGSASRASKSRDILSSLITLGEIFRVVSVTGGDDVCSEGFGRESSVLHGSPKAIEDHSSILGRRHGGRRDGDQPPGR